MKLLALYLLAVLFAVTAVAAGHSAPVPIPSVYLVSPWAPAQPIPPHGVLLHLKDGCAQVASARIRVGRVMVVTTDASTRKIGVVPDQGPVQFGIDGVRWISTSPGLTLGGGMLAAGSWASYTFSKAGVYTITWASNQCPGPITADPNAILYKGNATKLVLTVTA